MSNRRRQLHRIIYRVGQNGVWSVDKKGLTSDIASRNNTLSLLWQPRMSELTDFELLSKASLIYSQQLIAETINHPREVINRWIKEGPRKEENWLPWDKRMKLNEMLPKPVNQSYDFTFIDLFAGIGGIRYGFESAGGKCVFTSEYDKYAVKTYLANYHCDHEILGDIREVTQPSGMDKTQADSYINETIPDHDVLLAGFPCQPFSIAGVSKKNSLGRLHGFECNTQGTLFFDVARILEVKRPAAVMLENVKNLKSHDRGKTFRVIMSTLDELGYDVVDAAPESGSADPKIVNGKHFVPQNRERIVIVAFRRDLDLEINLSLKEISKFFPEKEPKVRDILELGEVDKKYTLTPKLWSYLKGYAEKHRKAGNGFGYGLVKPEDRATRTLSARYYKDGSEALVYRGPNKRPRRLTPRECARLMGFDEPGRSDFKIPVSDTQAYKQFGNSVVVPVFSAVARLMKPYILEAKLRANTPKRKSRGGIAGKVAKTRKAGSRKIKAHEAAV